jgi:hypothetical protein
MRGPRAVLVVAGHDVRQADRGAAEDRWLHLVAARWAASGTAVTWLADRAAGLPVQEMVDGVQVVRGKRAWRRGFDAVLVRHPSSPVLPWLTPTVHLVSGFAGRRAPRGTVVVRSPAERRALRAMWGLRHPIFVVPPGLPVLPPKARSATPCVAVSGADDATLREIASAVPGVRVGDVAVLDRAWLLVSSTPGWDGAVVEAARRGVPCVARPNSALADVMVGWLGDAGIGALVATALAELADPVVAARMAESCRELAGRLGVERGADLLAGILSATANATGRSRRSARPDLSTVVGFPWPADGVTFRATDEVWVDGEHAVALLHGCDEVDARIALARQGSTPDFVRLATGADLLAGPARQPHVRPAER